MILRFRSVSSYSNCFVVVDYSSLKMSLNYSDMKFVINIQKYILGMYLIMIVKYVVKHSVLPMTLYLSLYYF